MSRLTLLSLILALFLTAMPAFAASPADLVLRNGKIVTVDDRYPEAQALAVRGDTIVAVGSDAEITAYIGPKTRVIDLKGALAIPGMIDAHAHFVSTGQARMELDLSGAADWDEIVRTVGEAARRARPGQWICGHGWHQEKWKVVPHPNVEGFPLHDALSKASPDNPVILEHASGHAIYANAKAMQIAGVTASSADPVGGRILKDASGNPAGLFMERAGGPIEAALQADLARRGPAEVEADLRKQIQLASEGALSRGLTTVCDAGSSLETIALMKKLVDEGNLRMRVWMMLREPVERLATDLPKVRAVNYGDKRFTVRAVKFTADGALGSRGAWMLEPYADMPSTSGINTEPLENIRRAAALCLKNDFQLCIHAIGDRTNREILDIYQAAFQRRADKSGRNLRWRIEHAQHLNPRDIPRFGQLGVIASMQGIHCTSDASFVIARIGKTRAEQGAYVWQSLMRSGAVVCNGTDAPVESIDPLLCFQASITRRCKDGTVFFPTQCMDRMQALRSYTINAAYAAFDDGIKGSLTVGKLADITVLSKDIMTIPADEIATTKVLYTIVGGKVEYAAPPSSASVDVLSASGALRH